MSLKHSVNVYLCDCKLPNCIKCKERRGKKNEKQTKFQFCPPCFRHKLHFFPTSAPVSIQSSHWIFLLNFLQSLCKCRIHRFFPVFQSSQQPVRGDCISFLISRNEHPLHQHLFTWHYSFWHTFRHFRFGVQKVHTQLEFQRSCGVSINFMIRKESNSGELSAVLAMDASSCSEVPCCAALTAAEKGKWNAAWAKSPVIKNSCSS